MTFELKHTDSASDARAGVITTDHGQILTPIFMPVGTVGSVKGVHFAELREQVREMFAQVLETSPEAISDTAHFIDDLCGDSLQSISLSIRLEEKFDLLIPTAAFMSCVCVNDVAYLHIKDKAGADDVWDFPAPGKGRVDFDGIFDVLRRAGNESPFSVEIEFTPEGPGSLAQVDQAVRDSAAFFRAKGFNI